MQQVDGQCHDLDKAISAAGDEQRALEQRIRDTDAKNRELLHQLESLNRDND